MTSVTTRWLSAAAAVALLGALAACGGGEEETRATPTASAPGAAVVSVRLQEFAVIPAQASAPAGRVTFQARNNGPDHNHELVVIKTDLAQNALPTTAEGSVDENGAGIDAIGEIEEFVPGETQEVTFALSPGAYVLVCNVVETHEGMQFVHYKLGMHAAFRVT
jgi:uncharacterized cupredoxin-like copper-binding protein